MMGTVLTMWPSANMFPLGCGLSPGRTTIQGLSLRCLQPAVLLSPQFVTTRVPAALDLQLLTVQPAPSPVFSIKVIACQDAERASILTTGSVKVQLVSLLFLLPSHKNIG